MDKLYIEPVHKVSLFSKYLLNVFKKMVNDLSFLMFYVQKQSICIWKVNFRVDYRLLSLDFEKTHIPIPIVVHYQVVKGGFVVS